jgi:hypothetical protein
MSVEPVFVSITHSGIVKSKGKDMGNRHESGKELNNIEGILIRSGSDLNPKASLDLFASF